MLTIQSMDVFISERLGITMATLELPEQDTVKASHTSSQWTMCYWVTIPTSPAFNMKEKSTRARSKGAQATSVGTKNRRLF
jgi:hypothetical protein